MTRACPHPPVKRTAAETLLRDTTLPLIVIARRTGIPASTIGEWSRSAGLRKNARPGLAHLDPAAWPERRRLAVERLFHGAGVDPRDLAEALGARRSAAPALLRACGLSKRRAARNAAAPGIADLTTALRAHIARQIAAFDANLRGQDTTSESARVLRDLAGLKRLIDELDEKKRDLRHGDADAEPPHDLAALRERIARRCAALAGGRTGAPPPGEASA